MAAGSLVPPLPPPDRVGCRRPDKLEKERGDSMLASQAGLKPEKPTVLVVEDEVLLRLMIAEELRNQGIHVLEASNADEALTILGSSLPVHLLFTDIRMPGRLDGAALARLARAHYPQLKLIMTSSNQPEGFVRETADAFIAKPYDLQAVVEQAQAPGEQSGVVLQLPGGARLPIYQANQVVLAAALLRALEKPC